MRGGTLPLSKVTSCVVKSVSDARVRLELARGCFGEESPQMALLVQMHSSAAMLAWIDLLRAVQEDQRQREAWHAAGGRGHAPEGLLMDTSARTSELEAGGDHGDEPTGGGEKRPKWGLRSSLRRITALTRPLGGGKKKRIAERKARSKRKLFGTSNRKEKEDRVRRVYGKNTAALAAGFHTRAMA